jgi:TonB family protein
MKTQKPNASKLHHGFILSGVLILSFLLTVAPDIGAQGKVSGNTEIAPPPPPPPVPGQKEGDAYLMVDVMPQFSGGDAALLRFIGENTRYPKEAKEKNIMGRVIVKFMVTADGSVAEAGILKGVAQLLDNEALRVVNTLPKFTPGQYQGQNVPVWYMIPITFTLNNDVQKRPSRYEIIGGDTIYSYTESNPQFTGGNEAFRKYRTENLVYPADAKKLRIEGFVIVRFVIEKDGTVTGARIERGVSPALDNEALRLTRAMPAWKPGSEKGKNVKFYASTVYQFVLKPQEPLIPKEGEPFVVVEEMPMFPGGDSTLLAFIAKNTKYPEAAKRDLIQGRVIVRFCVMSTGGVNQISVLKGVDPMLDAEAVRVVSSLPAFKPGKQGGKPVDVWYMVPITFSLGGPAPAPVASPNITRQSEPAGYDVPPVFKGGEKKLYKLISSKIKYPAAAKAAKKSGNVLVSYIINPEGIVEQVSVLKGVDPELDAEAIRVVKSLPKWTPATLNGKPIKVMYTTTVKFVLK